MIYLSRLLLNPRHKLVRRDIADCQRLHRTILHAFPPTPPGTASAREHCGLLYRLDRDDRIPGRLALLLQSRVAPDWSSLESGYALDTGGEPPNPDCKPIDQLLDLIHAGIVLRFRLRANPTRKIAVPASQGGNRRNGTRVELREEDQLLTWLSRKGVQHGFELMGQQADASRPNVRVLVEDKLTGMRSRQTASEQEKQADHLTFGSALFDGVLRVTDVATFRRGLEQGIGSGKAYGFGLLSLARY